MSRQQFREIDLSKWRQVGEGGNGKTYICPDDPDILLKVNNSRLSTLEAVTKEYNVSRKVQETGLSVPRMKEIVRVSGVYGTITERIAGKKSLSKICHDSPEKTEEMAEFLCERAKELFHISKEQFDRFWDAFARAYTGKDNHEEFDLQAKRFACIDIILRTHFMKPSFLEKMFFKMHVRKLIGAFK